MNIFSTPEISSDLTTYKHNGGISTGNLDFIASTQELLISTGFKKNDQRRQEFINLKDEPESRAQEMIKEALSQSAEIVKAKVLGMAGETPYIDEKMSAIWIENNSSETNQLIHRDSNNPKLVRATISLCPTRILETGIAIPINGFEWDKHHYPMGPVTLPIEGNKVTPTGIAIMNGTTYHQAPSQKEILETFKKFYSFIGEKEIPRIFGSIWGEL